MKQTITKCDICSGEQDVKPTKVMAITMGNDYEYGTKSHSHRPIRERIDFHAIDLCEACCQQLNKQPLRYISGFCQPGRYYFDKENTEEQKLREKVDKQQKEIERLQHLLRGASVPFADSDYDIRM